MTKSFVTGGTGFVGAHVVSKLAERGDKVTALARRSSNLSLLRDLPVDIVQGDITNIDSLLPVLDGADEVYHIAADYRLWARDPREIYKNNVEGTRCVFEAAKRVGASRVVYTSTVGCLGIPKDGSPGNEDTPVKRNELVGHYKKSKYDAERIAIEYYENGLPVVIVNPSTPVGPGDIKPTPTGRTVVDFLRGKMPAYVDTGLNLIAVEDCAQGHLLAAEKGVPGAKYILGNKNLALQEILQILAQITNRKAPSMKIPLWVAYLVAVGNTAAAKVMGCEPSIPIEGALMAKKKMFFTASKAVKELGLPQSPVEDALARAVEWFQKNGYF